MIFPFKAMLPYNQAIEGLSDVLESYSGGEQRIVTRNIPRQHFDCRYVVRPANLYKNTIAAGHATDYDLPMWHDAEPVTAAIGQTVISGDFRYGDFQGSAVLWRSEALNELVSISSATDSTVTLAAGPLAAYPAGSYLIPARKARLTDQVGFGETAQDLVEGRISWQAMTNLALATADYTKYKSLDVLEGFDLLSGDKLDRDLVRPQEWLDFGTGLVNVYNRTTFSRTNSRAKAVFEDRADIWKYRKWLSNVGGKSKAFWLPSGGHDLTVNAEYLSTDTVISVAKCNYSLVYQQPGFSHLEFVKDGVSYRRKVVAATVSGVSELLQIDSALGFGGTTFDRISYLPLVRMAADRVELNWSRQSLVETAFAVVGVNDDV